MTDREVREALVDAIFAATDDPGIWQSGNVDVVGVLRALTSAGWRITPDYLERAKRRIAGAEDYALTPPKAAEVKS